MKKTLFFCFIALACAFAQQKQRLAVLPSIGELEPGKLDLLTDKVREIASKTLPQSGFLLLRQDAVVEAIGIEDYFVACKEGTCIGELAKKANANFGARCDVFKVDSSIGLKFELYSVNDEAILETFTDYEATDFYKMLAVLEARLPSAFQKMITAEAPPPVVVPPSVAESPKQIETEIPKVEKSSTSFWVGLGLEVLGAAAIGVGFLQNSQMEDSFKKYGESGLSPEDYKKHWDDAESSRTNRNILYIVGGVLLASGIGVHICF